jgi:hypothetical protein
MASRRVAVDTVGGGVAADDDNVDRLTPGVANAAAVAAVPLVGVAYTDVVVGVCVGVGVVGIPVISVVVFPPTNLSGLHHKVSMACKKNSEMRNRSFKWEACTVSKGGA